MEEKTLNDFINTFEIDQSFADFVNFVQSKGVKVVILSDGFDLFIEKILKNS